MSSIYPTYLDIISVGASIYFFIYWMRDYRCASATNRVLPGATPCSWLLVFIGVIGTCLLVASETLAEYQFGLSQKTIQASFLVSMVAAAFLEELIFRGFLISMRYKVASCIVGSFIFTLLHNHFWDFDNGTVYFNYSVQALLASFWLFSKSLWWSFLRFFKNPYHSLIPCIISHLANNLTVFFIKFIQGYVIF